MWTLVGVMNVHPQTAAYRALIFVFKDAFRVNALSNAAQDGYEIAAQFLFSATLTQTFNNLSSALTGAAITPLANPLPFIAAGAAVAFLVLFCPSERIHPGGLQKKD